MKRCPAWHTIRFVIHALAVYCVLSLPCRGQQSLNTNSCPVSDPSELDLTTYQRELNRIQEVSKTPGDIPELRRSLPSEWKVKAGGQEYSVPTKEISDALRQIEVDPKKTGPLEDRLNAMRVQGEALSRPSPGASTALAEENLKSILSRGEFQEAGGPSAWDLMKARIGRWIFEHLVRLFNLFHINRKTGDAIGWAVLFAAVVALFYVVYRFLTKSSRRVDFHAEVEPRASDARKWVQEALAAADRGDFREAVHCAYWASVAHLEDIKILPRDRARTPRESLRLLDRYPKEQGILQAITRRFELIWYGFRPVSSAEWAGTKEELEKMGCLQSSTAPTVPS
jgi:Domain of unknown function (DUF4129)